MIREASADITRVYRLAESWLGPEATETRVILTLQEGTIRIAIFGTGGVGGYFGGRLAQAGESVAFIARGEHLRAMLQDGLRVESVGGDFVVAPCEATDDPGEVGEVDVVLVGVKAWQVTDAARAMRPMIGSETIVLPLQNGVEAPRQLAVVLGHDQVIGGLCKIIAQVSGPGHIRHSGAEPYVALGELDGARSQRVQRLKATLVSAGLAVEVPVDIRVAMWEKFLLISSISGVGAVTRAPIGVVLDVPETRRLLERAMEEVRSVALALDIGVGDDVVARTLNFFETLPPDGTASMQRDIMAGRPSELESQNGAVVRLGRQAKVATPVNDFLYASLLPQEHRAQEK